MSSYSLFIDEGSLPASGSVNAKAMILLPLVVAGKYVFFWSSFAHPCRIICPMEVCTEKNVLIELPSSPILSRVLQYVKISYPKPSYFFEIGQPSIPILLNSGTNFSLSLSSM